jgi:hypothetical protein
MQEDEVVELAKEESVEAAQKPEEPKVPAKFPGPYEFRESCGRGDILLRHGEDVFRIATFYKGTRTGKTGKKIHLDPLTLASDYANFMNYQFCLATQDKLNRKKLQDAGKTEDQSSGSS